MPIVHHPAPDGKVAERDPRLGSHAPPREPCRFARRGPAAPRAARAPPQPVCLRARSCGGGCRAAWFAAVHTKPLTIAFAALPVCHITRACQHLHAHLAAGLRHEYQSAALMATKGVNVPEGYPAKSVEEAVAAARKIGDEEVVVKSQILAGGRGLGTFTSGFQGGVHIVKASDVAEVAGKMLGQTLVTKQSGPAGKPVNTVMVAKKMDLKREMYFSILLNRPDPRPMVIACAQGGTSIEDLAESNPEAIVKVPIDLKEGMTDAQADEVVAGLQVTGDKPAARAQVQALFKLFVECDCTMVEVNPLAEDAEGRLIAADAKVGFDDNAAFRQEAIFALRDPSQEDPKEVAAAEYDLNYIALDGNIGCMVNGAGLAMATMDIIQLHGGKPANFLDVGGAANEDQVTGAFKIITQDPGVKCLLVNIFGGIMKCDIIAQGIVSATKEIGLKIPLVVRLEGTNVEEGKRIIEQSGLEITTASDLDGVLAFCSVAT